MTQDEIIEMAKLVVGNYEHAQYWPFFTEELEHFAKLVAAKERKAICETVQLIVPNVDWAHDLLEAIRARGEA